MEGSGPAMRRRGVRRSCGRYARRVEGDVAAHEVGAGRGKTQAGDAALEEQRSAPQTPVGEAPGSRRVDMRHLGRPYERADAAAAAHESEETGFSDGCGDSQGASKPLGRARRRGTLGGAHGSAIAPSEAAAREDGRAAAERRTARCVKIEGPRECGALKPIKKSCARRSRRRERNHPQRQAKRPIPPCGHSGRMPLPAPSQRTRRPRRQSQAIAYEAETRYRWS